MEKFVAQTPRLGAPRSRGWQCRMRRRAGDG